VRTKRILLFIFTAFFIFGIGISIYSDDILWETTKEPFFDKYGSFGPGARAIGMGEAFSAIADDSSAIFYNPAGLSQMDHNEISWTGGSDYSSEPYTGFLSLVAALGTQYIGISYYKPYHPIGYYPSTVSIPSTLGSSDSLFPGLTLPAGFPLDQPLNWYGGANGLSASQQQTLAQIYRNLINPPFQADQAALTYSTPLTSDRSFMFGLNVKYQFTDANYQNALGSNFDAWAWGLDMGFLYKLRIIEHLKDFNISIVLHDVSGSEKQYNTGIEKNLFFTSTIGLSLRTTELIQKEITSFSFDFNSVNDPAVFENEKYRLNFGFEQWFLENHFAVRGGLVDFLNPGPWRFSLGVSGRYLLGIDYAYVKAIPFTAKEENENDSHWITLYWMWGKQKRELPTPEVFASVEPISFAPRNGETAIFKLNAISSAGIDRWVLNILDKNNNLVKSYADIGAPPTQIVWNGTDNKYQLLSDGEYTFVFEATDKIGSNSSTPVQTVKIYTPVLEAINKTALNQLKQLLNQLKDREEKEDKAVTAIASKELEKVKKAKEQPTPAAPPQAVAMPSTLVPQAITPPANVTGTAAPQSQINILGFPNIESSAIKSAYISTTPDGMKSFNMDYTTENTLPKYILDEMALMVRTTAESLGYSVDQIGVNALYGTNNTMAIVVPTAQAQNYAKGVITAEQMLRGSQITLNGEAILPNF